MPAHIEPITPENYQAAFDLQLQCHDYPWSERVFSDCLTSPYFAFQRREQQDVDGYLVGLVVADEATLMDIGVSPRKRGQGLGQCLLDHFMTHVVSVGATQSWLEVRSSNLPAIGLYQRNGFELIDVRKGYYPADEGREDAWVMCKHLS